MLVLQWASLSLCWLFCWHRLAQTEHLHWGMQTLGNGGYDMAVESTTGPTHHHPDLLSPSPIQFHPPYTPNKYTAVDGNLPLYGIRSSRCLGQAPSGAGPAPVVELPYSTFATPAEMAYL